MVGGELGGRPLDTVEPKLEVELALGGVKQGMR